MRLIVKRGYFGTVHKILRVTRGNKVEMVSVYSSAYDLFREDSEFPNGVIVSDQPFDGADRIRVKGSQWDDDKVILGADFCIEGLDNSGLKPKSFLYVRKIKG